MNFYLAAIFHTFFFFGNLKLEAHWEENAKQSYTLGDPHRMHFGIRNFCNRVGQTSVHRRADDH